MRMERATITKAADEVASIEACKEFIARVTEGMERHIPPEVLARMDAEARGASILAAAAQHLVHALQLASAPREAAFGFGIGTAQAVIRTDPAVGILLASQGFATGISQGLSMLSHAQAKTEGNA